MIAYGMQRGSTYDHQLFHSEIVSYLKYFGRRPRRPVRCFIIIPIAMAMLYTNARSSAGLRTLSSLRPLRIAWMLLAAALVLVSCSEEDPPIEPPPQIKVEEIEARILLLINQRREAKDLPLLALADAVTREARIHSANMAAGTVSFGHEGVDQRIAAVAQTIPISAAAENVASNYGFQDPAAQAVNSWLSSTNHVRNIEGDYDLTGIGVARNASGVLYYTQMFVKSR